MLRDIGIPPYNSSAADRSLYPAKYVKPAPRKSADMISVVRTGNFSALMYNDRGSSAWMDGSFYRPAATSFSGYYPVGDYAQGNYNAANGVVMMVKDDGGILVTKPTHYEQVWNDKGSRADMDGSFWRPIPPAGYVAIGHVTQNNYNAPSTDAVRVIRSDCVVRCDSWLVWTDRCSKTDMDVGIWAVAETSSPTTGVFISTNTYAAPSRSLFYCINPDCIQYDN